MYRKVLEDYGKAQFATNLADDRRTQFANNLANDIKAQFANNLANYGKMLVRGYNRDLYSFHFSRYYEAWNRSQKNSIFIQEGIISLYRDRSNGLSWQACTNILPTRKDSRRRYSGAGQRA